MKIYRLLNDVTNILVNKQHSNQFFFRNVRKHKTKAKAFFRCIGLFPNFLKLMIFGEIKNSKNVDHLHKSGHIYHCKNL